MTVIDGAPVVHFKATPEADASVAFEALPSLVGQTFVGDWFAVDADRLEAFDTATYLDASAHPLDASLYPDGMVEGFHLLALLDHMMNGILYLEGPSAFGWNYGFDRVRFVSPIHVGERMRLTGTIGEVRPREDGFLVRQDCVVEVENRDRPGFVADWWVYWLHEAPGDG